MSPLPPVRRRLLAGIASLFLTTGLHAGNVLLVIADDLGADSFPLTAQAGASVPPMPNLATLKNSGVLFTRAYGHPVCSPSRAAMLTGRRPFRTGIGAQLDGRDESAASSGGVHLAGGLCGESGDGAVELAMFGKWHLNAGAGTNDTPRTIGGWPHFAGVDQRRAARFLGVDQGDQRGGPRRRRIMPRATRWTTRSTGSPRKAARRGSRGWP